MDDATLQSLRAALAATPDNLPLVGVLLRAFLDRGEPQEGLRLLGDRDPAAFSASDRLAAARVCVAGRDWPRALAYASDDTAEALVVRARALLELGSVDAAREAYDRAVAANRTVEDPELRDRIHTQAPDEGEDRPKLRLLRTGNAPGDDDVATAFDSPRPTVRFADVGGLDELKERIRRKVILPMQKPSLFQRFRKKAGGGVLLYGPPGCGKTLIARATAGECEAQFFNVQISDVLDMWLGNSEQKLHAIFDKARQSAPSVLFFDEIEALGAKRNHHTSSASANVVSQFLAELDGFGSRNDGVLILGATNVPWSVDAAFRRPGRFDRVLFVPPPDRPAREAILRIHLADRPLADDIDVAGLAKRTSGFSGADLEHVVETAADLAIVESLDASREVPIAQAHLDDALSEVKPTTVEWLTTARNYARYANESGQYDEVLDWLKQHGRSS